MLPPVILWNIWKVRNKHIFENVPMSAADILDCIKTDTLLLYNATSQQLSTQNVTSELFTWLGLNPIVEKASSLFIIRWIAPPLNWVKLNSDWASRGNPRHARGGAIFGNHTWDLIIANANYYGVQTLVYVETRAVLDGLRLAKGRNVTHLWLGLDSLLLVDMLKGVAAMPSCLTYLFKEIHSLMPPRCFVSNVFREGNQGADYMAKWDVDEQSSLLVIDKMLLPKRVQGILRLERSGLPDVRQK